MNQKELDATWKRFRATTEGEWTLYSEGLVVEVTCKEKTPIVNWLGFDDSNRSPKKHKANANFVAKAHQDVPKLLREIERLDSLAVALGASRAILLDNQVHLLAEVERLKEKLALAEGWLSAMNSAWGVEDEIWDNEKDGDK
jgi:hypothetical protein